MRNPQNLKKRHFYVIWGVRAREMRACTLTHAKFSNAWNDLKRVAHFELGHLEQKQILTRAYVRVCARTHLEIVPRIDCDMKYMSTKFHEKMRFHWKVIRNLKFSQNGVYMTSRMSDHDQMKFLIMSWPWHIFLESFMMIAHVIIEILHTQEMGKKQRKKETNKHTNKDPDNYKEWSAHKRITQKRSQLTPSLVQNWQPLHRR